MIAASRSGADLDRSRHAEHVMVRQAGVAVGAGHGEGVAPGLATPDLAGAEGLRFGRQATCSGSMIPEGAAATVWVTIEVLRHSTMPPKGMRMVSGLKAKVLVISTTAATSLAAMRSA
jgi:hypothetical protein